jgi:hypothetical protein
MVLQTTPGGDSNLFIRVAEWVASALAGAILGFLSALTTFRTKQILAERDMVAHKAAVDAALKAQADALAGHRNTITAEALRAERAFRDSLEALRRENDVRHEENRTQLRLIKRQQFLTLKALADMARASGVDKRFDDAIWKALDDAREED